MSSDLEARIDWLEDFIADQLAEAQRRQPDPDWVTAVREVVRQVTDEPHDYNPGDEYYSCSQAIDPDPAPGEGGSGSGCSDDERAGDPCDCGRDLRVARLLDTIARMWQDHPEYARMMLALDELDA